MTSIVIVGEAWGEQEAKAGRPFVGPSGGLLNAFLSASGIERRECYITNVFNFQPPGNKLLSLGGSKAEGIPGFPALDKGKYVRAEYKPEIDRLYKEITDVNPNVVVALGGTACWALLHDRRIKRLRGSPTLGRTGHKVFPTYHPAAVLREYKLRPIVFADFGKIRREAEYPEVRRPTRRFIIAPDLDDLAEFEKEILAADTICVDIETAFRSITCIGFAASKSSAIVIPFYCKAKPRHNYWDTFEEEKEAMNYVRRWLNLGKSIINQNILYDLNYLWKIYGIPCNRVTDDTMLLQHAAQPEMEKSLAFLSSTFTTEPQHKFMRSGAATLKKED